MHPRTADQLDTWPTQPLTGGYEGLHRLAGESFTGAVSTGDSWLFMLNGRCVGTEGRLDDFAEANGTAHTAPDAALPLLFSMFAVDGEERGQYYTGRTSLSTVHETLRDGGFTGYVELSENVISGDYYVAYYGGEPAFAAFVGQSDRLLTGEEAFDRACDEVGLYTVTATTLDVQDVPGRAAATQSTAPPAAAASTAVEDDDLATGDDPEADGPVTEDAPGTSAADADPVTPATAAADQATTSGDATDATPDPKAADSPARNGPRPMDALGESTDDPDAVEAPDAIDDPDVAATEEAGDDDSTAEDPSVTPAVDPPAADDSVTTEGRPTPPPDPDGLTSAVRDVAGTPAPVVPDVPTVDGADAPAEQVPDASTGPGTELDHIFQSTDEVADADDDSVGMTAAAGASAAPEEDRDVAGPTPVSRPAELEAARDRAAALERRLAETEGETRRLAEERDAVAAERDDLRERIARLEERIAEQEVEELDAGAAASPEPTRKGLTPAAALVDTDLFVRYGSRGDATLSDAHAGADNRDAVRANLDLEHHTRFDGEEVAVDGTAFESFLPTTLEHEFVDWFVRDLLFEVRDTGHADALRALYDVVPNVDRAELHGSVDVEDGSADFDVVCRDRLGNPLVCVDLHDSRDPATAAEMEAVLTSANEVASVHDGFAGAFLVASSFFDPEALELADEVTAGGGFLGGGRRASYVRVTRKRGYHLCLVEARERRFHVTVPEL